MYWLLTLCMVGLASGRTYIEWGRNRYGSIGNGNRTAVDRPVLGVMDCYQLSVGTENTACLNATGYVYHWGRNAIHPTVLPKYIPYPTGLGPDMCVQLLDTAEHSGCVSSSGEIRLWAWNKWGQLGYGNTNPQDYIPANPVLYNGYPLHCQQLSFGYTFTSCIDFDGDLYMWGNVYGHSPMLIQQKPEQRCVKVAHGMWTAGCVNANNELFMWMEATNLGSYNSTMIPMNISCTQFGFGYLSALCLTPEGLLYQFQHNATLPVQSTAPWIGYALLEPFSIPRKPTIVLLPNDEICEQISVGYQFYGCITRLGNLYMWGTNKHGQLGDGTMVQKPTPTLIPNSPCTELMLGGYHAACYTDLPPEQ